MTRSEQLRTQQTSTDGSRTRDSDARVLRTSGQAIPGRPTARPMTRQKKSEQDRGSPAKRSSHSRGTPAMPLPQTAKQARGDGPRPACNQVSISSHRTGTSRHQLGTNPGDSALDPADGFSDTYATARQPGPQARAPNGPPRLKSRFRGDVSKTLATTSRPGPPARTPTDQLIFPAKPLTLRFRSSPTTRKGRRDQPASEAARERHWTASDTTTAATVYSQP